MYILWRADEKSVVCLPIFEIIDDCLKFSNDELGATRNGVGVVFFFFYTCSVLDIIGVAQLLACIYKNITAERPCGVFKKLFPIYLSLLHLK